MATPNSKSPTKVLLATFIYFFLLTLNKVNSFDEKISFDFSNNFAPNGNYLLLQGDASVSETGVLQVTKVQNNEPASLSTGRARYVSPVHIWDSASGNVASFVTTFNFIMKTPNPSKASDGITFFLAPIDAEIPTGSARGYLALFNNSNYDKSNQIVAVEFDTSGAAIGGGGFNFWDPEYPHIGIDVNSIRSTKTVRWDTRYDEVANVEIRYQASTKTLTVLLTYPSAQTSYSLIASVDLKEILPEWVRIGFSASTGLEYRETHDVSSWYFFSDMSAKRNFALENNANYIVRDSSA